MLIKRIALAKYIFIFLSGVSFLDAKDSAKVLPFDSEVAEDATALGDRIKAALQRRKELARGAPQFERVRSQESLARSTSSPALNTREKPLGGERVGSPAAGSARTIVSSDVGAGGTSSIRQSGPRVSVGAQAARRLMSSGKRSPARTTSRKTLLPPDDEVVDSDLEGLVDDAKGVVTAGGSPKSFLRKGGARTPQLTSSPVSDGVAAPAGPTHTPSRLSRLQAASTAVQAVERLKKGVAERLSSARSEASHSSSPVLRDPARGFFSPAASRLAGVVTAKREASKLKKKAKKNVFDSSSVHAIELIRAYLALPETLVTKPNFEDLGVAENFYQPAVVKPKKYQSLINQFIKSYEPFESLSADNGSYMIKHAINREARVVFMGDLHGNIQSMCRMLSVLLAQGFIDNTFKINNPNDRIVFLGNYTGDCPYGLDTFALVMMLRVANPEQVILCRAGDTCTLDTNLNAERLARYDVPFKSKPLESLLNEAFNILPMAVFLHIEGTPLDDRTYIQCCHGGILRNSFEDACEATKSFLFSDKRFMAIDATSIDDFITLQEGLFSGEDRGTSFRSHSGGPRVFTKKGLDNYCEEFRVAAVFRAGQGLSGCKNLVDGLGGLISLDDYSFNDDEEKHLKTWQSNHAKTAEMLWSRGFVLEEMNAKIGKVFSFGLACSEDPTQEGFGLLEVAESWQKSRMKYFINRLPFYNYASLEERDDFVLKLGKPHDNNYTDGGIQPTKNAFVALPHYSAIDFSDSGVSFKHYFKSEDVEYCATGKKQGDNSSTGTSEEDDDDTPSDPPGPTPPPGPIVEGMSAHLLRLMAAPFLLPKDFEFIVSPVFESRVLPSSPVSDHGVSVVTGSSPGSSVTATTGSSPEREVSTPGLSRSLVVKPAPVKPAPGMSLPGMVFDDDGV